MKTRFAAGNIFSQCTILTTKVRMPSISDEVGWQFMVISLPGTVQSVCRHHRLPGRMRGAMPAAMRVLNVHLGKKSCFS